MEFSYASNWIRYAIRFIGTPYCSAWKYYRQGNRILVICARLIDNIEEADAPTKLVEIIGKADSWWNEDISKGAIKRFLYGKGLGSISSEGNPVNELRNYIWTSTETSNTHAAHIRTWMDPSESHILHIRTNDDNPKSYAMSICLFRDN